MRDLLDRYVRAGRPLAPLTRWVRAPLRWYFHRSKTLRHDMRGAWKAKLLVHAHRVLVGEHPADFTIHDDRLRFRSSGSAMAVHGYYVGEIEWHVAQFLLSRLEPGFTMVDVGAHHGVHALVVAHELERRGLAGHIHAFEPDPRNHELLRFNLRQNGLEDRVTTYDLALAERDGARELLVCDDENSGNTFVDNEGYALGRLRAVRQTVSTIRLDSLRAEIPRVSLIKIDVQGSEPLVLRGAAETIRHDRPVLVVEAVAEWPTTRETEALLEELGYDVFGLTAEGRPCPRGAPEAFISWDWVALPRPRA